MRWESEAALRALIEERERELTSLIEKMNIPSGAHEPTEEMLAVMIDLGDVIGDLDFLRGDTPDAGDPDAPVSAPVRPPPHLDSGSIALPEPDSE